MKRSLQLISGLFLLLALVSFNSAKGQNKDSSLTDGYRKFYFPGGSLSSEGTIRNGQPDGYWKAYYENGKLKSEGNRKDFQLDSLWKFYNESGKLILEVEYGRGKKNGLRISYFDKETVKENYRNDVKEGYTRYYYPDGKIRLDIPFEKGVEQGFGKEYASDGTIITLTEYKKGFIVDRQRINRRDRNKLKQGKWYVFYGNGKVKQEGSYTDDKKDGYFKDYSENGDLQKISKYIMDELQPDAEEIAKLQIRNEYYPDGKIKVSAMFRNDKAEGMKREYKPDGSIERSEMYHNGILTGEGLMLDDGSKDGPWKEYYSDGTLKAEGRYDAGKQVGEWKYYYSGGKISQTARFTKSGKADGTWKWFYEDGKLLREENFRNGLRDGTLSEYDEDGKLIQEGEFVDGEEDGSWFYLTGENYIRGRYSNGLRQGMWYSYQLSVKEGKTDSLLISKGNYIDDLPDGKHILCWDNGRVREEGIYVSGKKEGDWTIFNSDGTPFLVITYSDGIEIKFDGVKIKPPFEKVE